MTNNKYKVLLIEDDENLRSVMATMLGAAGYQVILAETCNLAITLFTSHLPDVSILDLGLPDMNGMRFLEFVRKSSLSPIIVLSARNNDTDKVLALDAGANDYVTKPSARLNCLHGFAWYYEIISIVPTAENCRSAHSGQKIC